MGGTGMLKKAKNISLQLSFFFLHRCFVSVSLYYHTEHT